MAETTGANKETLKALLKEAALGRVSPKMTKKERAKRFPKKHTGPVLRKPRPRRATYTAKDVRLKDIPPLEFAYDWIVPVDPAEYIETYEKKGASGVVKLLGDDAWNHAVYVTGIGAGAAAAGLAAKGTARLARWLYNKAKKMKKTKKAAPKKPPKNVKGRGLLDIQDEFAETKLKVQEARQQTHDLLKGIKKVEARLGTTTGRQRKNVMKEIKGMRDRVKRHNEEKLNPLREKLNNLGAEIKERSK